MATDTELVGRARFGDADAFGELVRRHHPTLYRTALAIVRSPPDAEDVTQCAWLQAYRHVREFRGTSSVTTWLIAITRNHAFDHRRARRRQARWRRDDVPVDLLSERCVSSRVSPEDLTLINERKIVLHRAVESLPGHLQTALRLWHSQHSYAEMAAMTGVAVGTMKSRVWEAKRRLVHRESTALSDEQCQTRHAARSCS